ncbi:MAG: AraC family ligand binding domain-containing protein [Butyrivibrio sp.]|nr:AraC family ligand binding domain-containing protein [Butyrivibrio sp.]
MQTRYDDLDLQFTIDGVHFQVLNMVFEQFERMIPLHSHSKYCYELHYIPYGEGTVTLQGMSHALSAGMLYVTGPHVEHEQHTSDAAPMAEYCVFLRAVRERGARRSTSSIAARFLETTCWIGTDRQNLHPLFQQLFQELHTRDPGFHTVTIALLEQLIVLMTRNYADPLVHGSAAAPQPVPVTQKSILIDECFLYEYATLTLPVLA